MLVKRSLRPSEWQISPFRGTILVPRFGAERILNEAAAMRFIAEKTDIPIPKFYGCFEDDEANYLVMEYVEGVSMNELSVDGRKTVERKLEGYLKTLRCLKSAELGGPSGFVIPPYRVMVEVAREQWRMKPRESEDLVFCHNDFSTHNVIVDPATLEVKAVIDWEYAGFFPKEFEGMYFRRPGPSVALEGELNDTDQLVDIMLENEMPLTS
ncbi:MAG: hypothetical protein Q9227_008918 [Pyrenula ochraceoflavens]